MLQRSRSIRVDSLTALKSHDSDGQLMSPKVLITLPAIKSCSVAQGTVILELRIV